MKLSYHEAIRREITKSRKMRDVARLFYYSQALNKMAVASWDTFKSSWAYGGWLRDNQQAINAYRDEHNSRFGYLGRWV